MTAAPRATPLLLWLRAGLLAAVALTVSVVGHVAADGLLPGAGALALLLGLTTAGSALFLRHRASPVRLVILLVVGQGAVHVALTALAGHRGAPTPVSADFPAGAPDRLFAAATTVVERTGSYADQMTAVHATRLSATPGGTDVPAWVGHLLEHVVAQGSAMVAAHLAAVVVLGLWLAVGEHALWTFLAVSTAGPRSLAVLTGTLRGLRLYVDRLLARVRRGLVLRRHRRDAVPLPFLLHLVVAHRGPPALLAS